MRTGVKSCRKGDFKSAFSIRELGDEDWGKNMGVDKTNMSRETTEKKEVTHEL